MHIQGGAHRRLDLHCKFGAAAILHRNLFPADVKGDVCTYKVVWHLLAEGESKKYRPVFRCARIRGDTSLWLFRGGSQSAPECLMKCDTIPASVAAGDTPINTSFSVFIASQKCKSRVKFKFCSKYDEVEAVTLIFRIPVKLDFVLLIDRHFSLFCTLSVYLLWIV
jgi:hypothetical protein